MKKKGVLALLMALSMVLAMAGTVFAAEKRVHAAGLTGGSASGTGGLLFSDVDGNAWYYPYLEKAVAGKIAEGYGDGSFRPSKTVSYGEFITMAVLHQESENYGKEGSMGLLKGAHWAETYYYKGLELGYFTEAQISLRQLDRTIPRKDMAIIAAGMLGEAFDTDSSTGYSDVDKSDPYEYYISVCSAAGVLEGYGDGSFRPEGFLKRCEAVKVVVAALEAIEAGPEEAGGQAGSAGPGSGGIGSGSFGPDGSVDPYYDPMADLSPAELMPQDKRQILEELLESLHFAEDEKGSYFEYDQPEIPEQYHLRVSCRLYGPEKEDYPELYSWVSDKDWRFHPENYDASAHHRKEYAELKDPAGKRVYSLSPIDDKSMNFIIRIYDSDDMEEYANFSIYLDPGRQLRLHIALKSGGELWQDDEPLPVEVFGWQ